MNRYSSIDYAEASKENDITKKIYLTINQQAVIQDFYRVRRSI